MMTIKQINEIDQMFFDDWLKKFQKENQQNKSQVDDNWMIFLAGALCDDCPLGYEASHRLADWIFNYINHSKTPKEYLDKINKLIRKQNSLIRKQEMAIEVLEDNFNDYKQVTTELLIAVNGCEQDLHEDKNNISHC